MSKSGRPTKQGINNKKEAEKTGKKQNNNLFVKGQSGNPNGRPKDTFSLITILKRELKKIQKDGGGKTVAEHFIEKVLKKAIVDGDVAMMRDIMNRVDGMPKQTIDSKTTVDLDFEKINVLKNEDLIKYLNDKESN